MIGEERDSQPRRQPAAAAGCFCAEPWDARRVEDEARRGGAAVERTVRVDDLHALTPSRYIEFGGAVLNELSYQQARNHAMAVKGVYVAHPGYSLRLARVTKGSVICAAGHEETPDLDSLLRVIRAAPHGSKQLRTFSEEKLLWPAADERKKHADRHTPKGQLPSSKFVAYKPWHWGTAARMQGTVPCPALLGRCVVCVQLVAHAHGTPLSMTSQDA